MNVVNPRCCGIDVHNAVVVACLRAVQEDGKVRKETREFSTMYRDLLALGDWLRNEGCKVVAMESTGVYWKPVYHVLSGDCEVIVGNPQDMKRRAGKKTDRVDADWISELLAHGLVPPSFIPPPEIRALRDLTRLRVQLVNQRAQAKNRVHKLLQDCNVKLSCVASDIFGKSGRAMLDALVAGERDPAVLAQLALKRLRRKIPELELALQGAFTEHHAFIVRISLEEIDSLSRQIEEIERHIGDLIKPYGTHIEQMSSIPGVDTTAAAAIIAEIGADASRFGSDKRLASWACVSPGNDISAGKRRSGRTNHGNPWLRRILVQCAWAARRTDTYFGRTFCRLQARIGGKKAALAVAHKILVIIYHLLVEGTFYEEQRYDRPNPRQEVAAKQRAIKALERLGYKVALEAVAS